MAILPPSLRARGLELLSYAYVLELCDLRLSMSTVGYGNILTESPQW